MSTKPWFIFHSVSGELKWYGEAASLLHAYDKFFQETGNWNALEYDTIPIDKLHGDYLLEASSKVTTSSAKKALEYNQ